jgi:hypothetical protein
LGANNRCDICGEYELLPFKCKYCGGVFCGEHRLPEKHGCLYDFKQKYRDESKRLLTNPTYRPNITNNKAPLFKSNKRNHSAKRFSIKITGLLKNKLTIGLIVLCLILIIGYYDYSNNQSDLYNTFIEPIANDCVSSVSGFIDPYYIMPYYVYALKQTESINGKTTNEYLSYPNGSFCFVTNYKNATNPSYNQLVNFLRNDYTEQQTYIDNVYTCTNFAMRLHDNAEANNLKTYIVTVDVRGTAGHMIDGFNTTDRGWVFIDDTGYLEDEKIKGCPSTDTYVNLNPGSNYYRNDVLPGASGNWKQVSPGTIDGYHIWDSVENYSIWNSFQYK